MDQLWYFETLLIEYSILRDFLHKIWFWVTSDLAIAYKCLWKNIQFGVAFIQHVFWFQFLNKFSRKFDYEWIMAKHLFWKVTLCQQNFFFWSDLIFEWLWAKHSIMSDFWQNYYFEQLSIKHSLWSDSWLRITIWISFIQAFDLYLSEFWSNISTILSKSS